MNLHEHGRRGGFLRAVSMGLSVCLLCGALAAPALADNKQQQLEDQKKELQAQLEQEKEELKNIQNTKAAAQSNKKNLQNQSNLIKDQISVLIDQIADTAEQVAVKQQEVSDKQTEIDQRWADFKQRMVAMQQLHDGGAVAMLASCSSLYEMLTFNDTLEQITEKDNQVLEELENARQALAEEQAQLEATETQLEEQKGQLEGKQSELAANIRQQDATIEQAAAEEQAQQAVVEAANKKLDEASAALDSYIRSQNQQYANADIHCSLNFQCPLGSYKYITTQYGQGGHKGVDLAAPQGTPIYAAADGVVTVAAYHYSYGNYVSIYHGSADDGSTYATLYAHMMQAPSVASGQEVKKGDLIGYVGNTGYSFGNHLHLELRVNGARTNPLSYIPH